MKKCTEESENVPLSLLTHTAINVVAEAQQWGKTAFTLAAIFKQATSQGNLRSWALGTLGQNLAQTFSFLLPGSQHAYSTLCTNPAWQHTQLSTKSLYGGCNPKWDEVLLKHGVCQRFQRSLNHLFLSSSISGKGETDLPKSATEKCQLTARISLSRKVP